MDRKSHQAELIFKLGLLIKPLLDVFEQPNAFSINERKQIRARFIVERQIFRTELLAFCEGEPGAQYAVEWNDIDGPLSQLHNLVYASFVTSPETIASGFNEHRRKLVDEIAAFPVAVDSVIYEARTPFTAYCRIRELCATTGSKLTYVDRYVDDTIFHRFFAHVPDHVEVTVITWPRASHNAKGARGYDQFIDLSRAYARERPSTYRLLIEPSIHDRWLCCDDQGFHLGGSAKDAAGITPYTVTRLTSDNLRSVGDFINKATELFGPTVTKHP